ncbi:RNase adapter RapZ [Dolosigranulum pigrum]|uniref:RNase adapter RapZ n=1 Tax=Dolosigranulum pigrum TaxID=29394 RepID=UPI000DBF8072|nr:RNase adapter RapZ [Dolosigranulum pigrum]QTJ37923.1 RNase adapter RapZ [Dolosigranulum pigrum]QTJ41323.1 RNase adapter RapZ [Dolosigranulum pigrum]RAN54142.1 RNase adaptor protein RapZ [Dolosigranulum pigrum]RAN56348.1 RNase adaptor protein RapZ [Dolosigranulum pigrum]
MNEQVEVVIITGMSGAGKTVAIQSFEDMGYYCIDNMPPELLPTFWELTQQSGRFSKVALVMDLRMKDFFKQVEGAVSQVEETPYIVKKVLFLDAKEEELVSRYKESRRSHPLAQDGRVIEGIQQEKELLANIKRKAQLVIDTTDLTPRQLREKLLKAFSDSETGDLFRIELVSFGFKHGLPIDADIAMDVRFLPNPYYIPELREKTGVDQEVYDYVMQQSETEEFFNRFMALLAVNLPGYKREGKSNVNIAIGCTGGHHRSVALVERVAQQLRSDGYNVNISHRDKDKTKESVVRS